MPGRIPGEGRGASSGGPCIRSRYVIRSCSMVSRSRFSRVPSIRLACTPRIGIIPSTISRLWASTRLRRISRGIPSSRTWRVRFHGIQRHRRLHRRSGLARPLVHRSPLALYLRRVGVGWPAGVAHARPHHAPALARSQVPRARGKTTTTISCPSWWSARSRTAATSS